MKKRWMSLLLALVLMLSACGGSGTDEEANNRTQSQTETGEDESSGKADSGNEEYFTERDFRTDYDESTCAVITLSGDTAQCDSDAVSMDGGKVTILDEGTYLIRGTLEDGMIIVNADKKDKIQIVLDNANIHSEESAALYVLQGDKVFVTLAEGSENVLSNGGTFTAIDDNNIDGAVFSKEDITFNGSGRLTVDSPAGHGMISKDEMTFTGGSYEINCASHGIDGKDNVCITGAKFRITAGKDGIRSENDDDETLGFVYIESGTFDIAAEGDGLSAGSDMTIEDGTFSLVTGGGSENEEKQTSSDWGNYMGGRGGMGGSRPGGSGMPGSSNTTASSDTEEDSTSIKGIKAAANLVLNGGTFTIDSADDGIHANGNVTVNGGTYVIGTGDDGFHADDTLTIKEGTIEISESYEGLEGLHILISGGEIALTASDDGLNAAGGTDSSGTGGRGGDTFGGHGGMGGPGGMGGSSNGTIEISGGKLYIKASGDGIDANGSLEITGGYIIVTGPFSGDTATLDYDTSATISGGTFIGTGASGMAQTFSDSKQGVVAVNAGNQNAGTKIVLEDKNGNAVLEHEAELAFAVVILSSPDVVSGETYKITVGEASGEFEAS